MVKLSYFLAVAVLLFGSIKSSSATEGDTINFSLQNAIYSNNGQVAEVAIDGFCGPGLYNKQIETTVPTSGSSKWVETLTGGYGTAFTLYGLSDGYHYQTIIEISLTKLGANKNCRNWRLVPSKQ
jgi:hypothetical protein